MNHIIALVLLLFGASVDHHHHHHHLDAHPYLENYQAAPKE